MNSFAGGIIVQITYTNPLYVYLSDKDLYYIELTSIHATKKGGV